MRETSSHLTAPLASTETQGRSVGSEETAGFPFVLYPTDRPWVSKDVLLKTKTKTVSGKGQETFSIRSAVLLVYLNDSNVWQFIVLRTFVSEQLFFPIFVTFPLNCSYNIFPQEYYDQLRRIASKFSRGSLREKVSWL